MMIGMLCAAGTPMPDTQKDSISAVPTASPAQMDMHALFVVLNHFFCICSTQQDPSQQECSKNGGHELKNDTTQDWVDGVRALLYEDIVELK